MSVNYMEEQGIPSLQSPTPTYRPCLMDLHVKEPQHPASSSTSFLRAAELVSVNTGLCEQSRGALRNPHISENDKETSSYPTLPYGERVLPPCAEASSEAQCTCPN